MSNDQPEVACEYGAMGRHTWQRTADNTDICINCKRYRSVVPPTSAPKVEPVADSPASATDEVAAMVDKLTALCDLAGWADGGWAMPPAATAATARLCKAAATLIESLTAELADMTAERAAALARERSAWDSYKAERAIVARIWVQLGSPTYEELNGRSIYDLIDAAIAKASA